MKDAEMRAYLIERGEMVQVHGEVPQDERCQAILKYVYNWRCERKAVVGQLCRQHYRLGCRVPFRWEHVRNDRGVLTCTPIAPIEKVAPEGQ